MSTRHQAHLCEQALGSPNGRSVETATAGRSLTLPATHEHLHQLKALRTLGLLGGGAGGRVWGPQAWTAHSPRTLTRGSRPGRLAGSTGAHAPGARAAEGPPAPQSGRCSVRSRGWTRRPHPPCREQAQEPGSHGPHPSQLPLADPGPRAWVSLEPGRVDLQDLLGAGQSTDDAGLGHGLSGPRAPAALFLCNPTAPGSSPRRGVSGVHRLGERLQLKVPRVLGDVVSPQRCLLRGGGGGRCGHEPGPWCVP